MQNKCRSGEAICCGNKAAVCCWPSVSLLLRFLVHSRSHRYKLVDGNYIIISPFISMIYDSNDDNEWLDGGSSRIKE